jgi:hypothetical protein
MAIGDVTEQMSGFRQVSQLFFSAPSEQPSNAAAKDKSSKEEPFGDRQADKT